MLFNLKNMAESIIMGNHMNLRKEARKFRIKSMFDKVSNSIGFDKDDMKDILDKVEKQIADFDDSEIENSLADFYTALKCIN